MKPLSTNEGAQRGFTIVELMVAMTLSLLIIAAVGALYLSSKRSFRFQDNSSSMDETLRAVEEDMSREIRKAGYYGCFRWREEATPPYALTAKLDAALNGKFVLPKDGTDVKLGAKYDVRGGTATAATVAPLQTSVAIVPGTEYLGVTYGQPIAYLSTDLAKGTDPLLLNTKINVKKGQPLLVASCDSMTLMRADQDGTLDTIAHDPLAGDNVSLGDPVFAYPQLIQGSTVMFFQSSVFFVGQKTGEPPSLYLLSPDNTSEYAQPMAANIEQLNFQYGIDTGASTLQYVSAAAIGANDWDQVRAVRIGLVIRSAEDSVVDGASPGVAFTWDAANGRYNTSNTATDSRIRKSHVFTVAVRGRTAAL